MYGPAGKGKSLSARRVIESLLAHEKIDGIPYTKSPNKWWPGIGPLDIGVIIDDLQEVNSYLTRNLKIWGDIYPFEAEFKGGSQVIRPKMIIITSNFPMEHFWSGADLDAMKRRYKCFEFKGEANRGLDHFQIANLICYARSLYAPIILPVTTNVETAETVEVPVVSEEEPEFVAYQPRPYGS